MQVDAFELPQKLIPRTMNRLDVSAVPINHNNVAEAGSGHALNHVAERGKERTRTKGQRAGVAHVVLADPAHQPLGNEYLWSQALGHSTSHETDTAPVMLHRHVLEVLLDRGDRDEAASQFAGRHPLAKLTAREFC